MAQWFYRDHHGKERGPLGGSQILDLIRRGEIQSETHVRKDDSNWVQACEVNGLWQAAGRPSVLFHCPHCNSEIDRPPTICKSCKKDVRKAVGKLVSHSRPKDAEHKWDSTKGNDKQHKAPPLQ